MNLSPRRAKRGAALISNALPFGRLWYGEPNAVANAIGHAKHSSRSHDAVIRAYGQKNIRVRDRDQMPSTLILDSKIQPVLALRAALGAQCQHRLSSVLGEFPSELCHNGNKTSHTVLQKRVFVS